jgi:hypothetical protein
MQSKETTAVTWDCDMRRAAFKFRLFFAAVGKDQIRQVGLRLLLAQHREDIHAVGEDG